MKLVHLADLHLGFRQYQRQTATGINQREADVAAAFRNAITRIIELQPDIIVIAGDVFHSVRPTNPAILHAYTQFARLTQMLPDTDVVMVAGNHDRPRTVETGCLLRLFSTLGINVVEGEAKRFAFRNGELSVLAVPSSLRPRPIFDPDPGARYNVLVTHWQVEGVIPGSRDSAERAVRSLTISELRSKEWTYQALGHYHVHHRVASNSFFSGSLEYASSNIWSEVDDEIENKVRGKGFIERDLETGEQRFHHVKPAHRVITLPAVDATGRTSSEISAEICRAVEECDGGIDDCIVRMIVHDIPRHVLRDLDHRKIREFKRRALHFLLDARRPAAVRTEASGAPGRRTSLAETVRSMLEKRQITPGIDRKSLVDLGMHFLDEADRLAPALSGDEV